MYSDIFFFDFNLGFLYLPLFLRSATSVSEKCSPGPHVMDARIGTEYDEKAVEEEVVKFNISD